MLIKPFIKDGFGQKMFVENKSRKRPWQGTGLEDLALSLYQVWVVCMFTQVFVMSGEL